MPVCSKPISRTQQFPYACLCRWSTCALQWLQDRVNLGDQLRPCGGVIKRGAEVRALCAYVVHTALVSRCDLNKAGCKVCSCTCTVIDFNPACCVPAVPTVCCPRYNHTGTTSSMCSEARDSTNQPSDWTHDNYECAPSSKRASCEAVRRTKWLNPADFSCASVALLGEHSTDDAQPGRPFGCARPCISQPQST